MENNPSQIPPAAPQNPIPVQIEPPQSPSPEKENHSRKSIVGYVIAIITLLLGLGIGYLIRGATMPQTQMNEQETTTKKNMEVTLPSGAVQIQACANNKGALYVKPEDIPVGPIYMVHNGKVIGIEFMLGKEELLSGKSFKFLSGLEINVNHVNIGLLSAGHEGYTAPHYHVDLYLVDKEIESAITCPGAPSAIPLSDIQKDTASPSGAMMNHDSIYISPSLMP